MCPHLALPPRLNAGNYYAINLQYIKTVVSEFEDKNAVPIRKVKKMLNVSELDGVRVLFHSQVICIKF